MKEPELVTATQEELDEILQRARPALSDPQYRLLEGVRATFVYVMLKLQNAKTSESSASSACCSVAVAVIVKLVVAKSCSVKLLV